MRTFFALDAKSRVLFLKSFYQLGVFRLALRTRPFKRLVSGLQVKKPDEVLQQPDPCQLDLARKIGWAVRKASRFTPWQSTCLVQVLAAQRLLAAEGIGGAFYLGAFMGREDEDRRAMLAHAWLICGSEFITGEPGHERFTAVSAFSWPGA